VRRREDVQRSRFGESRTTLLKAIDETILALERGEYPAKPPVS
jgi:hypothetical protein